MSIFRFVTTQKTSECKSTKVLFRPSKSGGAVVSVQILRLYAFYVMFKKQTCFVWMESENYVILQPRFNDIKKVKI